MICDCHGEPLVWKTDRRRRKGGRWVCPAARAAENRGQERQLRYWHKADGGYIRRRKRQLAAHRERIKERLAELNQEGRLAQP